MHSADKKSSHLCTIFIYDDELKEWIGKTDEAENSDIEPVKGGLSGAFKRALISLRETLARCGVKCVSCSWDSRFKGIDDYFLAKKQYAEQMCAA